MDGPKSLIKQILKVTALYVILNTEICQDPFTCGQDDLVLLTDFHFDEAKNLNFFQRKFQRLVLGLVQ